MEGIEEAAPMEDFAQPPPEEQMEVVDIPQKPVEEAAPAGDPWYKNSKLWVNLIGYLAITLVLVVIKVRPDLMPNSERGFACDDSDLMYPIKPPSVQQRTLIISTVSILLMSVFISEGVYTISPEFFPQRSQEALGDVPLKEKVYMFINLVTSKVVYGYLGLVLTMNLTFHIQHLACGLRPTFLATCVLSQKICKNNNNIAQFENCQTKDPQALQDARMSFPSEFASISFYMTIFSSMIIERAISTDYFALKIAVQSSYIFWAIYASASCIKDHRNHPVDVLAGAFLGTVMAVLTDYLATYQDYQDTGYDPNNIMLNFQDWDQMEQPMMEEPMGAHDVGQDQQYPMY